VKKRLSFFTILVVFGLLGFLCSCLTDGSGLNAAKNDKNGQTQVKGSSLSNGKGASDAGGASSTSGSTTSSSKAKSVKGKGIGSISAAEIIGFIPNKAFPYVKSNWWLILIILALCTSCGIVCSKIKKKVKKPKSKMLFTALTVLVTAGLIGTVLYFGSGETKSYLGNIPQKINKLEQKITKSPASTQKSTTTTTQKSSPTQAYVVIADTLNIRSGPSSNNKIIGTLKKNDQVNVIKNSGQWWRIKYKNTEGYVRSNYLKKK
jgi:hypothetical protein